MRCTDTDDQVPTENEQVPNLKKEAENISCKMLYNA